MRDWILRAVVGERGSVEGEKCGRPSASICMAEVSSGVVGSSVEISGSDTWVVIMSISCIDCASSSCGGSGAPWASSSARRSGLRWSAVGAGMFSIGV